MLQVSPISLDKLTPILVDNYSDYSSKIANYLITLRCLSEINIKEFNAFKTKAVRFKVQDNHFFCRNNKNVSMRRVVNDLTERQTIF